jgi:hypothetical protein
LAAADSRARWRRSPRKLGLSDFSGVVGVEAGLDVGQGIFPREDRAVFEDFEPGSAEEREPGRTCHSSNLRKNMTEV